jgi:hypothetical protein
MLNHGSMEYGSQANMLDDLQRSEDSPLVYEESELESLPEDESHDVYNILTSDGNDIE